MYSFPNLEPVHFSISGSNCCFLTCTQISPEAGQVVCYSHLFKNFPQFVVIHTVKVFTIVDEADVFLEFCCFFNDPTDVGNLISGSPAVSKPSLNIWKFTVHILLKPGLETWQQWSVGGGQGPMISAEALFLVPPPPPQPTCWHHSGLRTQCPGRGPHSSALSPAPVQPFPPEHQVSRESLGAGPCLLFVSGPLGPWWAGARDGVDTVCNPQTPMEKCPGEGAWQDAAARSKDLCLWGPNPPPSLLHVLSLNLFKCLTKIQIKNNNHSTV